MSRKLSVDYCEFKLVFQAATVNSIRQGLYSLVHHFRSSLSVGILLILIFNKYLFNRKKGLAFNLGVV